MTFIPGATVTPPPHERTVAQAAHGLSAGDWIKVSGADTFAKARADSGVNAEAVGVVTEVPSVSSFKYVIGGPASVSSVLDAGDVQFLSAGTAGAMADVEPSVAGQVSAPVAVAIDTGEVIVTPQVRSKIVAPVADPRGIVNLGNFTASGSIGSASLTVDVADTLVIPQTTGLSASRLTISLTLPAPTVTTPGRVLRVVNTGTVRVRVGGVDLLPAASEVGSAHTFRWNGSAWIPAPISAAQGVVYNAVGTGAAAAGNFLHWGTTPGLLAGATGDIAYNAGTGVFTVGKPGVYVITVTVQWVSGVGANTALALIAGWTGQRVIGFPFMSADPGVTQVAEATGVAAAGATFEVSGMPSNAVYDPAGTFITIRQVG